MRRETFTSADGSTRCRACHLHPDACTCGHMPRLLRALGLGVPPISGGSDAPLPETADAEDDGERDACDECGESHNATESGCDNHCVTCMVDNGNSGDPCARCATPCGRTCAACGCDYNNHADDGGCALCNCPGWIANDDMSGRVYELLAAAKEALAITTGMLADVPLGYRLPEATRARLAAAIDAFTEEDGDAARDATEAVVREQADLADERAGDGA